MFLFFNPLGVHCLLTEKSKSKIMPCYFSISFFALFWKVETQGSGGLKACPGTMEEDSRVNLELCNTILLDADIKILYGVYQVEGAGQVTLYKTKGRKHISNIMCSSRKPSAYQQQVK